MTYLVGGGGGGGTITSVNGDTGPAVTLDASDVGAYPKITYADEATLLAASPTDGQFGYATAEDSNWRRENGQWVRWLGEIDAVLYKMDCGLESTQGVTDVSGESLLSGISIRKGGIQIADGGVFATGLQTVLQSGIGMVRILKPEADATIAAATSPATIALFGKTFNIGEITFSGMDLTDLYGNGESVPIANLWSAATPPNTSPTNSASFGMVHIATGSNAGYHFIYDVITTTKVQVIPLKQFQEALQMLNGVIANGALTVYTYSASTKKCTLMTRHSNIAVSKNDGSQLNVITGPDFYKTDGLVGFLENYGVIQSILEIKDGYSGTTSDSLLKVTNSNTSNNKPLLRFADSSTRADIQLTDRTTAGSNLPVFNTSGQIAFDGDDNRIKYYDGTTTRSIAHTGDVGGGEYTTVGTGGDYSTVGAAVSAGHYRIKLISNVTESSTINVSSSPDLGLTVVFGRASILWDLATFKITNAVRISVTGINGGRNPSCYIGYSPLASNHIPAAASFYIDLTNVSIENFQSGGESNTPFATTGGYSKLDNVMFISNDSSGTSTLWNGGVGLQALWTNVVFDSEGVDDVVITSAGDSFPLNWIGGEIRNQHYEASPPPYARCASLNNVNLFGVGLRLGESYIDLTNCNMTNTVQGSGYSTSDSRINAIGGTIQGLETAQTPLVVSNSAIVSNSSTAGLIVESDNCKFSNSHFSSISIDGYTHNLFSNCYASTVSINTSGDTFFNGGKIGNLSASGGDSGVITQSGTAKLYAFNNLIDEIPAGAWFIDNSTSILY